MFDYVTDVYTNREKKPRKIQKHMFEGDSSDAETLEVDDPT